MQADEYMESRILTGFIVSGTYIQRVKDFFQLDYLIAVEARKVANWCLLYFDKYGEAPGSSMRDLFYNRAAGVFDEDQMRWFEILLTRLSQEFENAQEFNVGYLVDETEVFCKKRAIEIYLDDVDDALESGDLPEVETLLSDFKLPAQLRGSGIFPFDVPDERVDDIFAAQEKGLFSFPKALDDFFGHFFMRGSFVAFMGAEKSGKSWWLMELAFRALRKGLKVAFFQAGDMTEEQMLHRIYMRQAGRPRWDIEEGRYHPVLDCVHNQQDTCTREDRACFTGLFDAAFNVWQIREVAAAVKMKAVESNPDYTPCTACAKEKHSEFRGTTCFEKYQERIAGLDARAAIGVKNKFAKRYGSRFYLSSYANDSLTVSQIVNDLVIQEQQNDFVPDVVIIDYADLLVMEGQVEERAKQNAIWKKLRAISQKLHCCLITATQADASSYEQTLLKRKNFSEDKRKYAHVTAMFGINVTDNERDIGLCRLNGLVVRDGKLNANDAVVVLQDLALAKTCVTAFK